MCEEGGGDGLHLLGDGDGLDHLWDGDGLDHLGDGVYVVGVYWSS